MKTIYRQLELVVPTDAASFWDETGTCTRNEIFQTFDAMVQSFPYSTIELEEIKTGTLAISIDRQVVYRFMKKDDRHSPNFRHRIKA